LKQILLVFVVLSVELLMVEFVGNVNSVGLET